jgi:hypothetical protein
MTYRDWPDPGLRQAGLGQAPKQLPSVPEFIDPVFAKTSPKRWFSMTENERFGLAKTGSRNSGTGVTGKSIC